MGEVILSWDDDQTSREALLAEMARVGFHPMAALRPSGEYG